VTFTHAYDSYTVSNIWGSPLNVHLTLPDGRTISGPCRRKAPPASNEAGNGPDGPKNIFLFPYF
jgi:hypothetical protein